MKRAMMKRLNPALAGAALLTCLPAVAAAREATPDVAQLCAEQAYRESGETHFEVRDVDLVFYNHGIYRVTLDTPSNIRVQCRVRDTHVTKLTMTELPVPAIAVR